MSNNIIIKWLLVTILGLCILSSFFYGKAVKYYKLYQEETELRSELELMLIKHNIYDKLTLPESDSIKITR